MTPLGGGCHERGADMKETTVAQEQIAIIAPANIKYVPYIRNYLTILRSTGARIHVLSWDKRGLTEPEADFAWHYAVSDSNRKKMLMGHLLFARKCKAYIRRHEITKLIILTAAPAFFLGVGFLKKFSGRYLLDIRDDSPLVRRFPGAFGKICAMAKQVVTSSPMFNRWIPVPTLLCHNADCAQIRERMVASCKQSCGTPISIVFAGMLNEGKINLELLRRIGKDSRFRFWFIGSDCGGKDAICAYVRQEGLDNVSFRGTYNKDEIYDIYGQTADLVNIIRVKSTVNRNALPNKLYDAALAGVPVVVLSHNEAIAAYAKEYHLGLVLEENLETFADTVAQAMARFDYDAYARGRRAFLQKVLEDMELFSQALTAFADA